MAVITLTSDFGLKDYRVSAIKGAIFSLKKEANIVDISHTIDAYDLIQTAYIVRNAYKYFPKGSVHIIATDSFYRKEVRNLIYKVDDHYFIAADNGIISLIFSDIKPESIHEITLIRFDDIVNFTSTDVFVPAAVHLSNGGVPDVIGRRISDPKELISQKAVYKGDMIVGQVMYVDNFGNVISNISKRFFQKHLANYTSFTIKFREHKLSKIYDYRMEFVNEWDKEMSYRGKGVAIFNEVDFLEIAIHKGTENNGANTLYGMKVGENIHIEFD